MKCLGGGAMNPNDNGIHNLTWEPFMSPNLGDYNARKL